MLVAASKAAALRLLEHPAARGLAGGSRAWQRQGSGRGEREADAYRAVEDLAAAAQASVKHASQGDLSSAAQTAVRVAEAGARGAAESARLAFETLTGISAADEHEGVTTGKAAAAAADASACAAASMAQGAADMAHNPSSMAQGAADVAHNASTAYSQTVGNMDRTMPGGNEGLESKYSEQVLRDLGGPAATSDWAGVMVQSAADESGAPGTAGGEDIGSSAKGSGAGGAGFAGPDASAESGQPGYDYGLKSGGGSTAGLEDSGCGREGRQGTGGGGGTVSERSALDDEFAVTKK